MSEATEHSPPESGELQANPPAREETPIWMRLALFGIVALAVLPMISPHGAAHRHGNTAADGGTPEAPSAALDLRAVSVLRRGPNREARSSQDRVVDVRGRMLPIGPHNAEATLRFLVVDGPEWPRRGPLFLEAAIEQVSKDEDWVLVSLPADVRVPVVECAPIRVRGRLRAIESVWGACSVGGEAVVVESR